MKDIITVIELIELTHWSVNQIAHLIVHSDLPYRITSAGEYCFDLQAVKEWIDTHPEAR